jgi:hypothetical protein
MQARRTKTANKHYGKGDDPDLKKRCTDIV